MGRLHHGENALRIPPTYTKRPYFEKSSTTDFLGVALDPQKKELLAKLDHKVHGHAVLPKVDDDEHREDTIHARKRTTFPRTYAL